MTSPRKPPGLATLPSGHAHSDNGELDLSAPAPAVVQTMWARLLCESFRRAGADTAIISPGSRSTPFVLAAEAVGMHITTIIDERAAGFAALGHARVTGQPAVLICTSGTAGAHYYPAVIEAAQSYLPLVVLTADRPPELQGSAAPQTIDQSKLYGAFVRQYIDLGAPEASPISLRAACRKAVQAVSISRAPTPGPVHVNAPARQPLEPTRPRTAADIAVIQRADAILTNLPARVSLGKRRAEDEVIASLARACANAPRGILIAGPARPDPALARAADALADAAGFPLFAEAASQLRFAGAEDRRPGAVIDAFDLLLSISAFRERTRPDLVLQIGPPPTSKAFLDYVDESAGCVRCVIADHGWNDPHSNTDMLIAADAVDTMERLAARLREEHQAPTGKTSPWQETFTKANELAWRSVDALLAELSAPDADMRESQAMRAIVEVLPRRAVLSLGNSLPIRTIDTYCPASLGVFDVLSQRGANGIDGQIAAAAGAARASSRGIPRPVAVIVGDVSFSHDIGALALAQGVRAPLLIIVIDNGGGRIFEQLPIARADYGSNPELFRAHWLTPPAVDMAQASAAYGLAFRQANRPDALAEIIREAIGRRGATVVRAVVAPRSATEDRARLIKHVTEALATLPASGASTPDTPKQP